MDDQRQGGGHGRTEPNLEHRPAIGLDRDPHDPTGGRDAIRPGSGGVDDQGSGHIALPGADMPQSAPPVRREQRRPLDEPGAGALRRAQIGGVERRHVDVAARLLVSGFGPFGPDARHPRRHVGSGQAHHIDALGRELGGESVDRRPFLTPPDRQRGAWRQEGAIRKIRRGPRESREGGGRKRLHPDPAIAFVPEGGRPPGGVNARAILRLDHHHPSVGRERGGEAGARDPGADDQHVGGRGRRIGHGTPHIGWRRECKSARGRDADMVTLW